MQIIKTLNGITPKFGNNCYLADNVVIIGDVVLGDNCSVWFGSIIRGDVNPIRIGNNVNIQDGAVLHTTYKKSTINIGNYVSVAHRVILHGCTINDNVLIGMGAIIMDNVTIESNCIIAAGSVVLENTIVEEGSVYGGLPAKKIKTIKPEQINGEIKRIANNYITYAEWYKK